LFSFYLSGELSDEERGLQVYYKVGKAAIQLLVQHSCKEKIPFIALLKFHVRAGVLAVFCADYKDIGAQTCRTC